MTPAMNWTQEGREVGVTLDACHAVVVVGLDPVATAEVALGIARVQAQHRRVAVADMFGDAPPLQALVPGDDPHGLVDSFLFGVSLNRIAYQVPGAGELFVMPSGTAPLDYEELFPSPRWRKLAAGFGEMGALLLICAPADAPQVRALVDVTDGAVLVGDTVPPDLPVAMSLAWLRARRPSQSAVSIALPPAQGLPAGVIAPVAPTAWRRVAAPAAGVVLAAGLAFLGFWFASRPFASDARKPGTPAPAKATSPATAAAGAGTLSADTLGPRPDAPPVDIAVRDSLMRDSLMRPATAPSDSFPQLAVANPLDSASASAYAVFLGETSTKSGAMLLMEQRFKRMPVPTYGIKPRSLFYLLYTGAFPTRAGADSLLLSLRSRRTLDAAGGSVALVPFAFLVQGDVQAADAATRVNRYRAAGHPVYALRQADGTMHLYFGAYATPQQAALAIPALRVAKLRPTLVYRVGRAE